MKNSNYLFLLLFILFQACSKDVPDCENCSFDCVDVNDSDVITNDCLDNYECTFKIFTQAEVDLEERDGHGNGNKNVLQLVYETQGDLGIADDEFEKILIMEIDESQASFSVEGTELKSMNVHYKQICFCVETDFKEIDKGCMQGERQEDGSWFVQGNLFAPYSFGEVEVKFDARFE